MKTNNEIEYKKESGIFWYPIKTGDYLDSGIGVGDPLPVNMAFKNLNNGKGHPTLMLYRHIVEAAFSMEIETKEPKIYLLLYIADVPMVSLPRENDTPDDVIKEYDPAAYVCKGKSISPDCYKVLDVVSIKSARRRKMVTKRIDELKE